MVEWLDLAQTRLLHGKTKKFTRLNTAFYSKPQGGVLGISSDEDDRRIFWGLKFSDPGFFWVRKFGKYFFG